MNKALSPAKLLERDVSTQIKDFLKYRGWRIVRNMVTKFPDGRGRWVQVGEVGMPDILALWYLPDGICVHLWIEFKKPKRRAREEQDDWHVKEARRGALVVTVNDFKTFAAWYEQRFAWIHTEDWVKGQKAIWFEPFTKSERKLVSGSTAVSK